MPWMTEDFIVRLQMHRLAFLSWLSNKTKDIFLHIPPNSLSEFIWSVGCCIPDSILGPFGCIPRYHKDIKNLSLVIGGTYRHVTSHGGLLQLKQLRQFSWHNFDPDGNDLPIFRSVLRNNSSHFISLNIKGASFLAPTLKMLGPVSSEETELVEYYFIRDEDPENIELHSLQQLSPTQLDIGTLDDTYDFSFGLMKLRSLRLDSCDKVPKLFSAIQSRVTVNLRTLHFVNDDDDTRPSILIALLSFLGSFSSLEELFILSIDLTSHHSEFYVSAQLIQSHRKSLKRLLFQPIYDYSDRRDRYYDDIPFNFLSQLKHLEALECLGVWANPKYKEHIQSSESAIKLVHFRMEGTYYLPQDVVKELVKSGYPCDLIPPSIHRDQQAGQTHIGYFCNELPKILESHFLPEIFEFTKWAFGPKGPPSLQVLSYGDFANDQKWSRLLLCRHHPNSGEDFPFRLVHSDSEHCFIGIKRGPEFLHEFFAVPPVYKRPI